jgi:hypothetical protein
VVGSPVDIPVADSLVGNLAEGSPADSPVDILAGIQVDSSLPEVRIVAGRARSIRFEDWSSRFEAVGSGNMVLERECGSGMDCMGRRLDGLGPGRRVVDPEELISMTPV